MSTQQGVDMSIWKVIASLVVLVAGVLFLAFWIVDVTGGNDVRDACRAAGGVYVPRVDDCAAKLDLP